MFLYIYIIADEKNICNNQKWVWLQSPKGKSSVPDEFFYWYQHQGSMQVVTWKLDLDQMSMAHTHI